MVIHGLKNDTCTPSLISSALDEENKSNLKYLLGGLSSIGSRNSIEGIFKVADKYSEDQYVQQEALKAFSFSSNHQKLQYLKNIVISNYKVDTKKLALSAFQNDGTIQSTNILTQALEQIDNPQLKNDILDTLADLPEQAIR